MSNAPFLMVFLGPPSNSPPTWLLIIILGIFAALIGVVSLLVWLIRLHRRQTLMYELMFEARAAEMEVQARELEAVEARIKEIEEARQAGTGPRLVRQNGHVA